MDEGMDTGAMLSTRAVVIGEDETSEQLAVRLSALGAQIVREDLPLYLQGKIGPTPQDNALASTAPMLTKEMESIDFREGARKLHAKVRGLKPWPGTSTYLGARRLIVHESTLRDAPELTAGAPGEVVRVDKDVIWVATGEGALGLSELQLEGKKRLRIREFLAGHPLRVGTILAPADPNPTIPPDPSDASGKKNGAAQ
jgi:methionyl-tRNA formyltransferase